MVHVRYQSRTWNTVIFLHSRLSVILLITFLDLKPGDESGGGGTDGSPHLLGASGLCASALRKTQHSGRLVNTFSTLFQKPVSSALFIQAHVGR